MIYVDTSVALAHLLSEDRAPRAEFWSEELVASRLVEYELWTRLHARGLAGSHGDDARRLTAELSWVELHSDALDRLLQPFPLPLRTLDAIHVASALFLARRGHDVRVASYDHRMLEAASSVGLETLTP